MTYSLSTEQSQLRQDVREFGQEHIEPVANEFDRTGAFPHELLSTAAAEGYVGHMIPETYGGPGYDMVESAIVTEETWRADTNLGWALGLSGFSTNVYVVDEYADEELRAEWFSGVASGDIIDGIAVTEPDHGSDVAAMETTAERDGDEWVLDGEKKFIGNSTIGDRLLVFAKTAPDAGHRGISAFMVPTDRDGYSATPLDDRLGGHSAPLGHVVLDDVHVPADYLVGEENDGFYYFMESLGYGRITVAAQAVGAAGAALDATKAYVRERDQFDQPIGDFQAVRHTVADMQTTLSAARSLLYRAATAVKEDEDDAAALASQAKLFATERASDIIDDAIQLHGGNGYLAAYDVERYFRDARATRIYEGASGIQRNIIADSVLDDE
ncbi:acyl-CoA dehydrogenase family protein [Halomicroarcula sp. GCM10025817]|uniref:acyl-CoA dehydrogenase family protein n=1 Tax=Haloarcula TaxID=2237 RepID=UPI0023E8B1C8|nr:acyl-CoA dehydrogenase family protein [Halomicroarcula sp. SYNS111]